MTLLLVGIAVGVLATLLVRTLVQFEREGLAAALNDLAVLREASERLEGRVRTLEALATGDEVDPPAADESDRTGNIGHTGGLTGTSTGGRART